MSDATYLKVLRQLEELYPMASGEVRAAAARCEVMMTRPAGRGVVIDIRTHAATLRRARQ